MKALRMLIVAACAYASWAVPNAARAQPVATDIESIDLSVLDADFVLIGTLVAVEGQPDDDMIATIAVEQTLKGAPRDREKIVFPRSRPIPSPFEARSARVVVAGRGDPAEATQLINLSDPKLEAMTAGLTILRTPDAVIEAARAAIRAHPGVTRIARIHREVPNRLVVGTKWQTPFPVRLNVPIDETLRRWAEATLDDPQAADRAGALNVLPYFRSEANIVRLQALLKDSAWGYLRHPEQNHGIEVRRYLLRPKAYETLRSWGVSAERPVIDEETVRPESVELVAYGLHEQVTPADIAKLADMPNLKSVYFNSMPLTAAILQPLGRLTRLQELSLSMNPGVTDAGLRELAGLVHLRHLNLAGTGITDAGMPVLANFRELVSLRLNSTQVTDAGLSALANLAALTELDLVYIRVTGPGLKSLVGLDRLRVLSLRRSPVEDAGLAALLQFPALADLDLSQTKVTNAGLRNLGGLNGLESLKLQETEVSDAGLVHLARLPSLAKLDLNFTRVTDSGLPTLAGMAHLKDLNLWATDVTAAGVAELRRLRPDLQISHAPRRR